MRLAVVTVLLRLAVVTVLLSTLSTTLDTKKACTKWIQGQLRSHLKREEIGCMFGNFSCIWSADLGACRLWNPSLKDQRIFFLITTRCKDSLSFPGMIVWFPYAWDNAVSFRKIWEAIHKKRDRRNSLMQFCHNMTIPDPTLLGQHYMTHNNLTSDNFMSLNKWAGHWCHIFHHLECFLATSLHKWDGHWCHIFFQP